MLRLFSCCFRRRDASADDHLDYVNERSHLIPTSSELPSPTTLGQPESTATIDHQRVKDRMESIVRAKENKMVNVNSRLPFNLHNLPPNAISYAGHTYNNSSSSFSSSSRSESRSNTLAAYGHANTHSHSHSNTPLPRSNSQVQVHVGAPLTVDALPPSASGSGSTSRGPQVHYASQEDMSRSSSIVSRETGEDSLARRRAQPILGLRLVKMPMKESRFGGGFVPELDGRRGRRKKRVLADGEEISGNATTPTMMDEGFELGQGGEEGMTPRGNDRLSQNLDSPEDDLDTPRLEMRESIHTDSTSTPRLESTRQTPGGSESAATLEICISPASQSTTESPRSVEHVMGGELARSSRSRSGDKEEKDDGSMAGNADEDADAEGERERESSSKPMKIKTSQTFVLRDDGPITVSWGD